MTTMSYEAVKARRFESDCGGDHLPRAGSIQDQIRFGTPMPLASVNLCASITAGWVADQPTELPVTMRKA